MLPSASKTPYSEILEGFEKVKSEKPEMVDFLDHLGMILTLQKDIKASFSPDLTSIDIQHGKKRNGKGKTFLKADDITIDPSLFNSLLNSIISNAIEGEENSVKIEIRDEDITDIFKGVLFSDGEILAKCADSAEIETAVFIFAVHQAVIPFLEAYAEGLRDSIDFNNWKRGTCPVCGGGALMGKLEGEGGTRILQCKLCRTEWPYKRVECPSCENTDQETLQYFYEEEKTGYRVDVCDKCKSYLKIADVRERFDNTHLIIEDALTLHLDIVARQEGYHGAGAELFGA